MAPYFVGQRVQFKGAGKVARLEGMAGKTVTATITAIHDDDNALSVMADHRTKEGAMFKDMGSYIPLQHTKVTIID